MDLVRDSFWQVKLHERIWRKKKNRKKWNNYLIITLRFKNFLRAIRFWYYCLCLHPPFEQNSREHILSLGWIILCSMWTNQTIMSRIVLGGVFFSFFSLSGPLIGPCFCQSSILCDSLRTNQTLVSAFKDPDVMRVWEEHLLFICLFSHVYFGVCSCFCFWIWVIVWLSFLLWNFTCQ